MDEDGLRPRTLEITKIGDEAKWNPEGPDDETFLFFPYPEEARSLLYTVERR